jgi:GNAT superfamily N-acetyltransferase
MSGSAGLEIRPVEPAAWADLVELFGPYGASSGCWCMWFRVAPRTWSANGSAGNRAALQARVDAGRVPGLLAYRAGQPIGWVSVAPRAEFARIEAGEVAPEPGVWSVVCFFIRPGQRGAGVGTALLAAAVEYARSRGGRVLEAYPLDRPATIANADAFSGPRSMFVKAGFREVGRFDRWAAVPAVGGRSPRPVRRPPGRPLMRLDL